MVATTKILSLELSDKLKRRVAATLSDIVEKNSITTYYKESPLLSRFREQISVHDLATIAQDDVAQYELSKTFACTVPLSKYADYLPFMARFLETPCRISRIVNLLAPGVPLYIGHSSGTTGAAAKLFPKYCYDDSIPQLPGSEISDGEAECKIYTARYKEVVDIMGGDGDKIIRRLPISPGSSAVIRSRQGFNVDADESLLSMKVPSNNTSPYAVCLIKPYRTFLLMHAFFALVDPTLVAFRTTFSTVFYDLVRLLEGYWDILIQAVDEGKLPNLSGLDDSRAHLEGLLTPDPVRAAELCAVNVGTKGWLHKVWPKLRFIRAAFGGSYGIIIPKLRHHLGSEVTICPAGYASTEVVVALGCTTEQLDLLKVSSQDYFEYLDIERPESAEELSQAWELQPGRKYELVPTTKNGLWRYRLGDVIEVVGFDPTDGQPLIRYVERRNMSVRISDAVVLTEQNVHDAIHSLKDIIGDVIEFTTFIDDRKTPSSCGYFVELANPYLHLKSSSDAPYLLHDRLSKDNESYEFCATIERVGIPSIHVVAPGTFRKYREWKIALSGSGSGQTKIPSVVQDIETTKWLMQKVAYEI